VQAAFDPNPVIRRLTVAAIATSACSSARAAPRPTRCSCRSSGAPAPSTTLDAGLTAIAAAERGDASFPVAVLRATPEVRGTMLAAWGAERLAGRPLREPEWRRLAGHVHAGRRGERLLRRLLRARTTGDVRSILQRICERRGGRTAAPSTAR
jgi:energy-converting hydrogenase Eha subunit A